MRVLLRAWSNRKIAGGVGLEKVVESEDIMADTNDPFWISDLGREVQVEKRPDEAPEGVDFELRFLIYPAELKSLPLKGWVPIGSACTACPCA